ncbi:MAG: TRAP transporter substrate-binding protein DctP [Deltaproteobacteria bacterium]|nr:TRAP transporter substrate-binding protein DctP [Deltaproteobacteria bacterium]MBW2129151.1 TRAP transporter substrate-binding protein DctP [Deltaproteobacteria bacterium]
MLKNIFKWKNPVSIQVLVVVVIILATFSLPAQASDVVKLRFSTYNPPRGMEGQMAQWLAEEIKQRSKGRITFEMYFGGSLMKARETLRGIQSGIADMGFIFVPYYPRELPAWTVAEPFLRGPVAPKKRAAFFWELYAEAPELKQALDKWNQRLVAVHVFGKHSVGGPRPLKSLADLKGLKVRCAGGYDALHMAALGANIVFCKGREVYSAMQKGAIDANYTPLTSYFKYKLYEIGKNHHLLVIPQFIGSVALITMNLDSFNKLSPQQQKALQEAGRKYSKVESREIQELEKQYSTKMTQAGLKMVSISKSEVLKWAQDCEARSKDKWLEKTKGKAGGQALLDKAERLLKKYQD